MIFHQPHNSLANYNYNTDFYTDKTWDYHFHRNMEIVYVINGAVNCTINNVSYRLTEGDFGLCLAYDIHRYVPEEDTRYWVIVFSEDYVRFFAKQMSGKMGVGFKFRCDPVIEQYIKERLVYNESPSTFTLKSCLYACCEEYLNNIQTVEKDRKKDEISAFIADYIVENHTKKISLADVAKKLGYDYNYMSRCFRKIFNMTFSDLVNVYRLETAIKLLEDTDSSITEITYESGFQSVRSFNYFFKNNIGVTPSQYRKAARK